MRGFDEVLLRKIMAKLKNMAPNMTSTMSSSNITITPTSTTSIAGSYIPITTYTCSCVNSPNGYNVMCAQHGALATTTYTYPSTITSGGFTFGNTKLPIYLPVETHKEFYAFLAELATMSADKLIQFGSLLKQTLSRYKTLDVVLNKSRELNKYENIISAQEAEWALIKNKVGLNNYKVRDIVWDTIVGLVMKKEIKEKEFKILCQPYLIIKLAAE